MLLMARTTLGAALLCSILATAAALGTGRTIWTVVAVDPKGDGRDSSLADAAQLSWRYDESDDMLWFRVSLFGQLNADAFGVNIAVDTGATDTQKTTWWGGNKDFAFDLLITAWVTKSGNRYTGTIGISDAAGAAQRPLTNRGKNSVQLRVEGDTILIGVKRNELTDKTAMNVVASVGSNEALNDDIPNVRSAAIDLRAPRPTRGLREIDSSRNNLTFAHDQQLLPETAPPLVVTRGSGPTPMVLIPGVYSGQDVFDAFIARNSARYTFHIVTPPGLAGTRPRGMPPPRASYGALTWTRRLAQDVIDLIERQHLERPIIVTHGFPGSLAADELALSHPASIGGIIEVASMGVQPYFAMGTPNRELTPAERIAVVDDSWAQQWFKYVTPETWESNNYPAEMLTNDSARAERVRREIESVPLTIKIRYLVEFMATDPRPLFGELKVPVLVLQPGFNEQVLSTPTYGWFKASFLDNWTRYPRNSRVELVTIPDARALLLDDQPALADQAIERFARGRSIP
jgi:pimeloyl-ACP methyl ester carboxylesterase